jgi:two-component system, NarL family, sensor histidine kinase DesK
VTSLDSQPGLPARLFGEQTPPSGPSEVRSIRKGSRGRWLGIVLPMAWLISPLSHVFESDPATVKLVLVCLGVLAFAVIYIFGVVGLLSRSVAVFAVLSIIGVLLTLLGTSSFALLFIYAGTVSGLRLGRWALPGVLLSTVLTLTLSLIAGADFGTSFSIAAVTLSIGGMMLAFGRLISTNLELECARHELARVAVDHERLRFARDLHDLLGHSLSVIALKAELAGRLLREDTDAAAVHVGELEGVARKALSEVRDAVSGYRRPVLAAELDGARMALQAAGIEARLQRTEGLLDPDVESLLAWTVREGTTNVIRHSGASNCRVAIEPGPSETIAEVTDDGCGPGDLTCVGNGLAGLRERVEHLAGRLEAGSGPHGGFCLRVTVPIGEIEGVV